MTRSPAILLVLAACTQGTPSAAPSNPALQPGQSHDPRAWDPARAEEVLDATWYGDVLVSNRAFVLDDAPALLGWERVPGGAVRLDFATAADAASVRGDAVLVSGKGGGLLRRVTGLSLEGASLIAQTQEAVLTDVLLTGRVFERTAVPLTAADLGASGARDLDWDFSGRELYAAGSGANSVAVRVKTGSLQLRPDVDAGIDVDWLDWSHPWPRVEKADLGLRLESSLAVEIEVEAHHAWSGSGQHELFSATKELDFRVGPLPVGGTLHLDGRLDWTAETSADGVATVGATVDATAYLGGHYEGGTITNRSSFDLDAERLGPTLELDASGHGRVTLVLTGHIDLYGKNSLDAEANAWADLTADVDCGNLAWDLDVGAGFDAEVAWDVLGASGSRDFEPLLWSKEPIAEGTLPLWDAAIDPSCGTEGPVPATTTDSPASGSGSADEAVGGADPLTDTPEELETALTSESCTGGIDDDGDGRSDCADSECADSEDCGSALESWEALSCGGAIGADTAGAYAQNENEVDAWPINVGNYSGPEAAFTFVAPFSGTVLFAFVEPEPTVLDLDIIVLESENGAIRPEDAIAWGGNAVEVDVVAGGIYIIVVDGYGGAAGPFTLESECGG